MAHLIDQTAGRDAIAYVGATPWHGLGTQLQAGASIHEWTVQAGLNYDVCRSQVKYEHGFDPTIRTYAERHVLYRSDTLAPLSVVSQDYSIVQPETVMGFFEELTKIGGFVLETAGALDKGRRIWALAKVNDGAPIIGNDLVKPYVLLTTSYDGTLATTGKLTAIRVVCNNTLTAAVNGARTEIKVPHSTTFNAQAMRRDLGIFADQFDKWFIETRRLAEAEINLAQAGILTEKLIAPTVRTVDNFGVKQVKDSRGYKRVMELFDGQSIGADMAGFTKWGWLNAVTQYIDHERGRSPDTRINSAWFGTGDGLKSQAYAIATA